MSLRTASGSSGSLSARLLASASVPLALLLPGCVAPSFQLAPRYGTLEPSGSAAIADGGVALTANDIEDDLNLDEDSSVPGVRFDADFGSPTLMLAALLSSYSGEGVLTATVSEGGVEIDAGTPVATDLDLDVYSLLYTFDLIPSEHFELALGLGIQAVDLQASIVSLDPSAPGTVSVDETLPIPVLALRAGVAFDPFELAAVFSGVTVEADGDEATYYDLDVTARWRLLGGEERLSGSLAAGWRQIVVEAEYDDAGDHYDLDLEFSGPYLALVLGF